MRKVGVIPFAAKNNDLAILFVTSMARGRWILPKGNMRPTEDAIAAARREALEEAGVSGKVLEEFPITVPIGKSSDKGVKMLPVTYYPLLVDVQYEDWQERAKRDRHWALLQAANRVVHRQDFLELLKRFESLVPWIREAVAHNKARLPKVQSKAP